MFVWSNMTRRSMPTYVPECLMETIVQERIYTPVMCGNYLTANNMRRNRVTILKRVSVLGFLIALIYLCLQTAVYHVISVEPRKDDLKKSNISIIQLMPQHVFHNRENPSDIHPLAPVPNITEVSAT